MRTGTPKASLLAAILLSLTAYAAEAAESVGIVTALEGNVYVGRSDEIRPVRLAPQAPIYANDVIETQARSRLRILFQDDHLLTVAENTRIGIQAGSDVHLFLDHGTLRSSVAGNGRPRRTPVEIITPHAVIETQDAYFTLWVDEEAPALTVRPPEGAAAGDRPVPMPPATMPMGQTGLANIGTLGEVTIRSQGETRVVEPGQFIVASPRTPPPSATQLGMTPPFVVAERIRATAVKETPRAEGAKELLRVV